MRPSSQSVSTRVKAEVVIAEVEGEPLEPNTIDEGEAEVVVAEGRRRAPQAELYRRE